VWNVNTDIARCAGLWWEDEDSLGYPVYLCTRIGTLCQETLDYWLLLPLYCFDRSR